jgi:hypothetical protein
MITRMKRFASLLSLGSLFWVSGCLPAPGNVHVVEGGTESGQVDLSTWCHELGNVYCSSVSNHCFDGISSVEQGCLESFASSCLAGRVTTMPSGRSGGELAACASMVRASSCGELGGLLADPLFIEQCQADPGRVPGVVAPSVEILASSVTSAAPALEPPTRLMGHWAAAPPASERRAFLVTRYALAEPPREAELAQMNPTPEEARNFHNVLRLLREEPGSPLLAQLRERIASLRAISVDFTPTKLIARTASGVSITPYRVEEDLGDTLVLLEEGERPLERRRTTITFLDDDSLIMVHGATRVEMERVQPWEELTATEVPHGASRIDEPVAPRPSVSITSAPPPTGDPAFDQCVVEYFACLEAMPPEAQEAMGPAVDLVRLRLQQVSQDAEDRRSFTETCRGTVSMLRAAGYCGM